jgi:HSP20 family protein
MSEEMDRAFGDFGFGRGQGESGIWSPAIEVNERDGNYTIHAELPGLKPEDVKVEVTDDALVIQGERKSTQEEKQGGVRRTEIHYGQFYRSIPLPEGVNPEQVRAKFENGILEVTTPVPQQKSNARQIPIEGATAQSGAKQPAVEHQKAAKAGA